MKTDLYQGDCLDIMRGIPDKSVDAAVTDPPFGIGFNYDGKKDVANAPEEYWKFFAPIYGEICRIVKDGGFIAIWQTQLYFPYFWEWYGKEIHIYAACKNFVQLRKTPINYGYDPVVMRYVEGVPLRPNKPKRNIDYFVANTAKWITQKNTPESKHPCPRPIDQVTEIVSNFTAECGIILDPFMGSGTTGVACLGTGRSFIGIEKDPNYFQIAKKRIEEAQVQVKMAI